MGVKGTSPGKDFEVVVPVAEEKQSYAWQELELHQLMLDEYLEDKLRAGMHQYIDLIGGLGVADEIPALTVSEGELRGALHTTWVNRWIGLAVRSRSCVRGCSQYVERDEHVDGTRNLLLRRPPSSCAPGRVLPREGHLVEFEESGLQTSKRVESLAK